MSMSKGLSSNYTGKSQTSFMSSNTGTATVNLTMKENAFTTEAPIITEEDEFEALDDLHLDLLRGSDPAQNQQIGDIKDQVSKIKEILNQRYELHREAKEKKRMIKEKKDQEKNTKDLISYLDTDT